MARVERYLPWIAGAVLAAGIAVFLLNRSQGTAAPKHVPLDPAAARVAREFIATAVARRDLARAYELVTPELRSGQSLAEWKRGTIAVVPYPVRRARLQPFKVVYSYSDRALLGVTFVPKPGEKIEVGKFRIGLLRVHGSWLVASWVPSGAVHPPGG